MKSFKTFIITALIVLIAVFFIACGESEYIPKPHGYFRIEFPEKEYIKFDSSSFPYTFEYPTYAKIESDKNLKSDPFWLNIVIKKYNATIYLSYKKINSKNDLAKYIEDTRAFVMKHIPKSTGILDTMYKENAKRLYGIRYEIQGTDAASPLQFFLTDSTKHFFRAALYFNNVPNNDSLDPVIKFIKQDVSHLIETFNWK